MGLDNPLHIAFLVVILLLLFGARRIPELGRSLGGGIREFMTAISGDRGEIGEPEAASNLEQQPADAAAARLSDQSKRAEQS